VWTIELKVEINDEGREQQHHLEQREGAPEAQTWPSVEHWVSARALEGCADSDQCVSIAISWDQLRNTRTST